MMLDHRHHIDPHASALFTDLYELTMSQAYYAEGLTAPAVFELFFRELPPGYHYVMGAGLDDVLRYLETLRFTDDDLAWLQQQPQLKTSFIRTLRDFRFTGDVYAVPEGTIVFADEPLLQVVAPLPEAQLIETYVLNQIHVHSLAATKAARVVTAAQGRNVVDFGSRRAHGTDAALKVARNSYLAGAAGTSNMAASRLYGVPAFGTMAHSYIQAHADELSAFRAFAGEFPDTTLLVDTYDTLAGVRTVIDLAQQLGKAFTVRAIRLDSGDLETLAKQARQMLDEAGLHQVSIIASSGLDEHKIATLLQQQAPIDGFGVGTKLAVSSGAPEIDFSYKLVAYDRQPRLKLSTDKVILPGQKQLFRLVEGGRLRRDLIAQHHETHPGNALLQPVMRQGRRLEAGHMTLEQSRKHAQAQLASLEPALKTLAPDDEISYPVEVSRPLQHTARQLQHDLASTVQLTERA